MDQLTMPTPIMNQDVRRKTGLTPEESPDEFHAALQKEADDALDELLSAAKTWREEVRSKTADDNAS